MQPALSIPLPLGTRTPWGIIKMIGSLSGERYYWMVKNEVVSMMPASVVEEACQVSA